MSKCEDVYGEPIIIRKGNNIARVYSPILTDEEYNRRMEAIKRAAAQLVTNARAKANQTKEGN